MAAPSQTATAKAESPAQPAATDAGAPRVATPGNAVASTTQAQPVPPKRAAHYLWGLLIARIYEVFPLSCPICGGQMRIIAFTTHRADIRHILDPIGVQSEPPHISPAREPPLWEDCDAQPGEGSQIEPDWATGQDETAQPAPDFAVDQRVNW